MENCDYLGGATAEGWTAGAAGRMEDGRDGADL